MKNKKTVFFGAVVLALFCCLAGLLMPRHPFASLNAEDIASIHAVFPNDDLFPPYALTADEQAELIAALHELVIYNKTMVNWREYGGGWGDMFRIDMNDGSKISISANNPFFIMNETAYRTESKSCDKIDQIYWRYKVKYVDQVNAEPSP